MRTLLVTVALMVGFGFAVSAQTPAPVPVTALCKDGTNYVGKSRSGACRGHGGVQAFNPPPSQTAQPVPPQPAPSPAPASPARSPAPVAPPTAAAGGGPGVVWVNTASKVYHCQGDRYYGATKAGKYVTEAAARAEGDRPDHGKACS